MSRPIGVTILAILAGLAGLVAVYHTLQYLHILPVTLTIGGTDVKFFTFDLLGALLWGILALIWFWVMRMLWNVDPRGWMFVVALSILNIVFAFISILGETTFEAILPAIVINGIILLYGLLPGTRRAFGT